DPAANHDNGHTERDGGCDGRMARDELHIAETEKSFCFGSTAVQVDEQAEQRDDDYETQIGASQRQHVRQAPAAFDRLGRLQIWDSLGRAHQSPAPVAKAMICSAVQAATGRIALSRPRAMTAR